MTNEEISEKVKGVANQLIKIEEQVIDLTEKTINQAENPTVKYLLRAIQHDSRKHADLGRVALEILEYKKIVGTEERKEIWDLLKKHDDMERKHREFVGEIRYLAKTPALQYIFEQIWADEKKDVGQLRYRSGRVAWGEDCAPSHPQRQCTADE